MTEKKKQSEPMSARSAIRSLGFDEALVFPIERLTVMRVYTSALGLQYDRKYHIRTDREKRTLTITRSK